MKVMEKEMKEVFEKMNISQERKDKILKLIKDAKEKKKQSMKCHVKIGMALTASFIVVIGVLFVANHLSIKDNIVINQKNDVTILENKMVYPDLSTAVNYTWEQVCEYYGKDISLKYIPDSINNLDVSNQYMIYRDKEGNVLMDNIELDYTGEQDAYISVITSKGKLPVMDVKMMGGKKSSINGSELTIYQNEHLLEAVFLYQNIGYDIKAYEVSEEEFMKVLKEIFR